MPRKKLETITREEFDRRLDAHNEQMRQEVQQKEAELARVEQLLPVCHNGLRQNPVRKRV